MSNCDGAAAVGLVDVAIDENIDGFGSRSKRVKMIIRERERGADDEVSSLACFGRVRE